MLKAFFRLRWMFRILARRSAVTFSPRRGSTHAVQPESRASYKRKALSARELRQQIGNLPSARVHYVVDGDTAIVSVGWRKLNVRLDSIDCPEDGQDWGDIARYGLMKLINRQVVQLEEHGQDDYGRTLATLYVRHPREKKWLNVNERMVVLGHAWVMRRYYDHLPPDRQSKLEELERWARARNVGLWGTENPMPPWEWRNNQRDSIF